MAPPQRIQDRVAAVVDSLMSILRKPGIVVLLLLQVLTPMST
jgi:hypothetical protein